VVDAGLGGDVEATRHRLSLRGLLHFLFERAGFNRWTPAMAGRRHQAVIRKYLMAASQGVQAKGVALADRLYVPEAFDRATHLAAAQRRRDQLALLKPVDGRSPLALVVGEFKAVAPAVDGVKLWIRHMPDAPLFADSRTWSRIARRFAPLFDAPDADGGFRPRLIVAALIRARQEGVYAIDSASLMLTSATWIPVAGVYELPLIEALSAQRRRFVKPLAYDAPDPARFANAVLLDVGAAPLPLHVFSAFMTTKERASKEAAVRACDRVWVWPAAAISMPDLPAPCP
jgi:hypothetical protein